MSTQNPNLLLVKCITGTYLNHTIPEPNKALDMVVEDLLSHIKMPTAIQGEGSEGEVTFALKLTLDWIQSTPKEITLANVDIIERVRVNCGFALDYVESLERLLVIEEGKDQQETYFNTAKRVESIVEELRYSVKRMVIGTFASRMNKELNFSKGNVDLNGVMRGMREEFDNIEKDNHSLKDGFSGRIDFSNVDSICETLEKSIASASGEGVLKTGLRGLNDMWGLGGYRAGGSYNYGALTHNYKTGILLDHCRWLPMRNVPVMIDKNRKPMFLRISFENKPEQDVPLIYRSLWEAENGKRMDLAKVDLREAAKYIQEKLGVNGYHFEMLCFDPNNMTVWDLITIIDGYIEEGYEIHAVIVDYLELITKKGGAQSRADERITHAFETLRNHCFGKGITQINAHQLSTEAQQLSREGTANFAVKVSTGGWYMNCKSLHTKLDGECILHIHKIGETKYLTFGRGKDRDGHATPARRQSFAYKFEEYGGIVDDVDLPESKAIYEWSSVAGPEVSESGDGGGDDDW